MKRAQDLLRRYGFKHSNERQQWEQAKPNGDLIHVVEDQARQVGGSFLDLRAKLDQWGLLTWADQLELRTDERDVFKVELDVMRGERDAHLEQLGLMYEERDAMGRLASVIKQRNELKGKLRDLRKVYADLVEEHEGD